MSCIVLPGDDIMGPVVGDCRLCSDGAVLVGGLV